MNKITCPECKKEFGQNEALSGGWLTPKKVFGCPHCQTYFTQNPYEALAGLGIAFVIGSTGLFRISHGVTSGDHRWTVFGLLLLLIAAAVTYWCRFSFRKNVRNLSALNSGKDTAR
jgi:hypothetical protein